MINEKKSIFESETTGKILLSIHGVSFLVVVIQYMLSYQSTIYAVFKRVNVIL